LSAAGKGRLAGRTVLLGVMGSIAAYKAVLVARLLLKEGARVRVILTAGGARFVGASTFSGLTGEPVLSEMFVPEEGGERHVALAAEADLVAIVPATADALARFAGGRADDLLAATVLCARGPVLIAPAMHPSMWHHPATARNVATLANDGRIELVGPVEGEVASGDTGLGRLMEPADIVERIVRRLAPKDLAARRIVVTAGPTVEDIDAVRFVSNRSSQAPCRSPRPRSSRAWTSGARCTCRRP
jgi:phosphopantothenoylcysteine decarboxylase/phosphopantothenate--cysteine ligase